MDIELKDFLEASETFLSNHLRERDRRVATDILATFQLMLGNRPEYEAFQQAVAKKYSTN